MHGSLTCTKQNTITFSSSASFTTAKRMLALQSSVFEKQIQTLINSFKFHIKRIWFSFREFVISQISLQCSILALHLFIFLADVAQLNRPHFRFSTIVFRNYSNCYPCMPLYYTCDWEPRMKINLFRACSTLQRINCGTAGATHCKKRKHDLEGPFH